MSNRFWFTLLSSSLLLTLAACGNASGTNTTLGTQTSGPVSISTDHSTYEPTDSIQVTVLNTLAKPIYALDTQASCSILGLEIQVSGKWQTSTVAKCLLGRPAQVIALDPQKAYTTTIQAASPPVVKDAVFPPGTYRLVLNYSTSASAGSLMSNPTTIFSATFSVAGPASSSTPSSGTPTTPTVVPPPPAP